MEMRGNRQALQPEGERWGGGYATKNVMAVSEAGCFKAQGGRGKRSFAIGAGGPLRGAADVLLLHAPAKLGVVGRIYQKHHYLNERRNALNKLAAALASDKIVALADPRRSVLAQRAERRPEV
jgi:hypothetical protein